MKQSIYYLHIPRTSGVFIRDSLKKQKQFTDMVCGHIDKLDISKLKDARYTVGHYGITPIKFNQMTFTVLRDPDQRLFSYMKYIWKHFYSHLTIERAFDFFINDLHFKEQISNQQSKFLTSEINLELYNLKIKNLQDMVYNNWCLKKIDYSFETVKNSISKNNIQILFYDDPKLYNKIFSILDLDLTGVDINDRINSSIETDADLYKKYKNNIHNLNKVDWEIYEYFRK